MCVCVFWRNLYSTAVLCGDPGTPAEGYMEGKQFTFRSEVTFYCRSPYILVGSSRRVCQVDGSWSGVQPTCIGELACKCGPVMHYLRNNAQPSCHYHNKHLTGSSGPLQEVDNSFVAQGLLCFFFFALMTNWLYLIYHIPWLSNTQIHNYLRL